MRPCMSTHVSGLQGKHPSRLVHVLAPEANIHADDLMHRVRSGIHISQQSSNAGFNAIKTSIVVRVQSPQRPGAHSHKGVLQHGTWDTNQSFHTAQNYGTTIDSNVKYHSTSD